jgi:hypothetical protein
VEETKGGESCGTHLMQMMVFDERGHDGDGLICQSATAY